MSYQNLVESLQGLEDVHECHYFGARSFRILHTLSKTWDLPWPEEMLNSKLLHKGQSDGHEGTVSPIADPLLVAPNTFTATATHLGSTTNYPPINHAGRRESLSMFSPQGNMQLVTPGNTRPGSVPAQQEQSPALSHDPTQTYNALPYQFSQSMPSVPSNATPTASSMPSDPTEAIFWNPIPGLPGPILPRNAYPHISPMGLDSVLQHQDIGDRLGRDGFKISEDWQPSHVNSFNSGGGPSYGQQGHQPQSTEYMQTGTQGIQQQKDGLQYRGQTHGSQQGGQGDYSSTWYGNHMS